MLLFEFAGNLTNTTNTPIATAPVITLASFSFPLTFMYFFLAALATVSIGRVLYFRHKFLSFQGGFLFLSLIWALLRALMLLFVDLFRQNAPNAYRLLLWMPEIFQLATFSLLVVFFGLIIHPTQRKLYIFFYALLNGLFIVLHLVVFCLLVAKNEIPPWIEALSDTLSFFVLSVSILTTGVLLLRLLRDPLKGGPALAQLGRKSSFFKLSLFVGFVVTVLVSRSIVELLIVLNVVEFTSFGEMGGGGFSWKGGVWFSAFVIWEVIPIGIFIVSYWPSSSSSEMPKTHHSSVIGDTKDAHNKPVFIREVEPLLSSNLFANPARYDSDGEDAHFESGSMYSPYFTNSPQLMLHNHALNKSIN